jgi:hypothetical protein
VTTYREIESAWWKWAYDRVSLRMPALAVVQKIGGERFLFDGTAWTVRLHPVLERNGVSFRNEFHFVGADGRVLRPLRPLRKGAS